MRIKRTLLAIVVTAQVIALPQAAADAQQDQAADPRPSVIRIEEFYAAWDTCGEAPAPGQTCTVTAITASRQSDVFVTDAAITVNRGVYDVTATGEKQWRWDDGWYAFRTGAIQFTINRHLDSATASGTVHAVTCGADGSACGNTTHDVSITLIAAGETTTGYQHGTFHQGVSMTAGTGSIRHRPAIATAIIDGAGLGESLQAYMDVFEGHSISLTRTGGIKGLGELYRPLWHLTPWGSGPQASAQLDSCGAATAPGDVCHVTWISAAAWTDYGWTELELRRFSYTIDGNGQRLPGLVQQAIGSPITLAVDRLLRTATATGVVEFNECTGELPPPNGSPPPNPGGEDPPGTCTLVPHEVTVAWTATGKRVQVDDSFAGSGAEGKFTSFSSSDFRPAVATGTFDGEDMGESTWAQIIDRQERLIVNGNGRNMNYFPPWAVTPADADEKVTAEWDTCEYAARDGVTADEPNPGDLCTWTGVTVYEPSGSDQAQLWMLQLTHRYGESEPILVSWWEGRGTVDLTADAHLDTATVSGVVDFVGCSDTPTRECATGTRQISATWQAVEQAVRLDTEQFRLSTAIGSIDGEAIPGSESRWAVIGAPLPGKSER